jgi:hypothetical protein
MQDKATPPYLNSAEAATTRPMGRGGIGITSNAHCTLLKIFLYNTRTLQLFTINQSSSNVKYMQQMIKKGLA